MSVLDTSVTFRCTSKQRQQLRNKAQQWGMTLSSYGLKVLLGKDFKKTELTQILQELYRLRGSVAKIGGLYVANMSFLKAFDPRKSDLKRVLLQNQSCQSKVNDAIDTFSQKIREML